MLDYIVHSTWEYFANMETLPLLMEGCKISASEEGGIFYRATLTMARKLGFGCLSHRAVHLNALYNNWIVLKIYSIEPNSLRTWIIVADLKYSNLIPRCPLMKITLSFLRTYARVVLIMDTFYIHWIFLHVMSCCM